MHDQERIAKIIGDWAEQHDRDELFGPDEVCLAHPELASALRAQFVVMGLVDKAFSASDGAPETLPHW